jgi:hypothetical protein
MILGRQRIDAGIDADVADQQLRALDKVRDLIDAPTAETTRTGCHRRAPSLPGRRYLAFGGEFRKESVAFSPLWLRKQFSQAARVIGGSALCAALTGS